MIPSCIPVPHGCESDRTCACAGAELCGTDPSITCSDDGPFGAEIECACLLCP